MTKDLILIGGEGADHAGSVFCPDIEKPGKVAIFGASGFSRECADIVLENNIESLVYVDLFPTEPEYFGFPLVAEDQIPKLVEQGYVFVVGVGENSKRKKIVAKYPDLPFPNIIHPTAKFGNNQRDVLKYKKGNIITAGVCFTNNIEPGNFGIYNLNATIGHDCVIKDFINIAPGANISGNVFLDALSYIGTGASIIQGRDMNEKILIGRGAMIGAGAVVTKNVGAGVTVAGVPAKPLKVS